MSHIPTIGANAQPKQQVAVVENGDGTQSALPVVAVGLISDATMQMIANIVGQIVAAELNARGITPLAGTAKSS